MGEWIGDLEVLYRDERMLAVCKPSGMLSVPGRVEGDCVVRRVGEAVGWAREVHRLDMDTSGVMLLGLDEEAHRDLCGQFERREVLKEYVALVKGEVEVEKGVVEAPMRKDMAVSLPPRHVVDYERGKAAVTEWEVIAPESLCWTGINGGGDVTRLRLRPLTGRSHQLRVHMKVMGHGIVGDVIYGDDGEREMGERLMLHAEVLEVRPPELFAELTESIERVRIVAPCEF